MRVLRSSIGAFSILLTACVPVSSHYERIEVPDAVRFKNTCGGTVGPPSTVYYPFHGIYISLNYSATNFGLHIPEGMTVQLSDNVVKIRGLSTAGEVQKAVHIKVFKQGAGGNNDPPELRGLTPNYAASGDLGPFEGASVGNRHIYVFFMGIDDNHPNRIASVPFDLTEGTIELPAMTINGQRYEPQILPFKQTKYFEISPVNC
jgi:hypothetical protein